MRELNHTRIKSFNSGIGSVLCHREVEEKEVCDRARASFATNITGEQFYDLHLY